MLNLTKLSLAAPYPAFEKKKTEKEKGNHRAEIACSKCLVSNYMITSNIIKDVIKNESCTCEARSSHLLQSA